MGKVYLAIIAMGLTVLIGLLGLLAAVAVHLSAA